MKRILMVLMAGALALGVTGASGCVTDDDANITCDDFDYYLSQCYPTCGATWDCEYYYDGLDLATQLDLDWCSSCLADEADWGTCGDCLLDGVDSCHYLMEYYVGVSCVW